MTLPSRARKILFWSHLVAGIASGLVILVMASTGILLSFERQIIEAADGYEAASQAPRLPLRELHEKLKSAEPGARPTGMALRSDPSAPVAFQFGPDKTVYVDPGTGVVLGEASTRIRAFFRTVTEIHRWLALKGQPREIARSITAAAVLVFLFIIVSGILLWIPKRWTRKGLRSIAVPNPRLKGRARDWNWHNALGIWSALPLLVMVSTGLIIAYPWANHLLFSAVGEKLPERKGGKRQRGPGPTEGPESISLRLDQAVASAGEISPDWTQMQFSFPEGSEVTLFVSDSHRGRPDLRREITVDLSSGSVTETKDFSDRTKGQRLRTWVRWIHTGEAGGWVGQLVAALASGAAVLLIGTGFALSFRRFFRKRSAAN